jgi:hypothetical protein
LTVSRKLLEVDKRIGEEAFSDLLVYDTAHDSVRYSSGNPGIGFWSRSGSASNQSLQ